MIQIILAGVAVKDLKTATSPSLKRWITPWCGETRNSQRGERQ